MNIRGKLGFPALLRARGVIPPIPMPLPSPLLTPPPISAGYRKCSDIWKKKTKNTLVLDIDETLLHTYSSQYVDFDKIGTVPGFYDLQVTVDRYKKDTSKQQEGEWGVYYYSPRPGLDEFLQEMSELFEVVFWTAGTSEYCAALVNSMERFHLSSYAKERNKQKSLEDYSKEECEQLSRDCSKVYCPGEILKSKGNITLKDQKDPLTTNFYALSRYQTVYQLRYMKYLPLLGRPLEKCLLIDDKVRSFKLTPRNAVLVDPYTDDLSDNTLAKLTPMLRSVAKADNVMVELDHWREDGYEVLDSFYLTCGKKLDWGGSTSRVAGGHEVGAIRSDLTRRETPVAPFKHVEGNNVFLDIAENEYKSQINRL